MISCKGRSVVTWKIASRPKYADKKNSLRYQSESTSIG